MKRISPVSVRDVMRRRQQNITLRNVQPSNLATDKLPHKKKAEVAALLLKIEGKPCDHPHPLDLSAEDRLIFLEAVVAAASLNCAPEALLDHTAVWRVPQGH